MPKREEKNVLASGICTCPPSARAEKKRSAAGRRSRSRRKRCHGELANRIIGQGTTVKAEKLSYRSFQRLEDSGSFRKTYFLHTVGVFYGEDEAVCVDEAIC